MEILQRKRPGKGVYSYQLEKFDETRVLNPVGDSPLTQIRVLPSSVDHSTWLKRQLAEDLIQLSGILTQQQLDITWSCPYAALIAITRIDWSTVGFDQANSDPISDQQLTLYRTTLQLSRHVAQKDIRWRALLRNVCIGFSVAISRIRATQNEAGEATDSFRGITAELSAISVLSSGLGRSSDAPTGETKQPVTPPHKLVTPSQLSPKKTVRVRTPQPKASPPESAASTRFLTEYDYEVVDKALARKAISPQLEMLPVDEMIAIYAYTARYFEEMNPGLRDGSIVDSEWLVVAITATRGLEILSQSPNRQYAGVVYRGIETMDDELVHSLFVEGEVFTNKAFMSTSSAKETAFSGQVELIVQSHSGVRVSDVSAYPEENEVLFSPGARFLVTSKTRSEKGVWIIEMTEVTKTI